MAIPQDLFCLHGPSKMYQREMLVVFSAGDVSAPAEAVWNLPSEADIERLLKDLGLPPIAASEAFDLGRRKLYPADDAPIIRCRGARFNRERYARLQERLHERGMTRFAFLKYYEAMQKKASNVDWLTFSALAHVFYHHDQ